MLSAVRVWDEIRRSCYKINKVENFSIKVHPEYVYPLLMCVHQICCQNVFPEFLRELSLRVLLVCVLDPSACMAGSASIPQADLEVKGVPSDVKDHGDPIFVQRAPFCVVKVPGMCLPTARRAQLSSDSRRVFPIDSASSSSIASPSPGARPLATSQTMSTGATPSSIRMSPAVGGSRTFSTNGLSSTGSTR